MLEVLSLNQWIAFSVKELDLKFFYLAIMVTAFSYSAFANKLIFSDSSKIFSKQGADAFNQANENFRLGLKSQDFILKETKKSLLGSHYYYQQTYIGHEVEGAELVVTLNSRGHVSKIYNNTVLMRPMSQKSFIPLISEAMALDLAWNHLGVQGELLEQPKAELLYKNGQGLVYKIILSTSSPFGHYALMVDATLGTVLSVEDAALPRMKRAEPALKVLNKKLPLKSFSEALTRFEKSQKPFNLFENVSFISGSAQVFDPNPVVTLGRTDLQDDSDDSLFTQAYKNEQLNEISFVNGVYHLRGPKVTLIDFESPDVAPATSADGSWLYERSQDQFNDVMTYLHIDRSVRYLESLGFTGQHAIFSKSLEIDANGVDGADNSHYIPSSRRLAFGHGCVDDNEDADVILHELGHAIQHHINPSWYGGDTGAMGEGFGDYWAASYSVTTENGLNTEVNWVFKWDGHNDCWPGRKLNAYSPTYNRRRTYAAHAPVDGGISDELWSTPIFQAFLEMYKNGVPRQDIDKIILEAHFGLGSGVKMPDMASSIVKTAKELFPDKDYDEVYLRHFKKMKIL